MTGIPFLFILYFCIFISRCREASADFSLDYYSLKHIETMKEFMDIWVKPFQECGLTRREKWIMAVAVPAAYVAVVILSHLLP